MRTLDGKRRNYHGGLQPSIDHILSRLGTKCTLNTERNARQRWDTVANEGMMWHVLFALRRNNEPTGVPGESGRTCVVS